MANIKEAVEVHFEEVEKKDHLTKLIEEIIEDAKRRVIGLEK